MLADGQPAMPVGASIGIALFPAHASNPLRLFECADQALYLSKRAGRNRATLYGSDGPAKPVSATRLRSADRDSGAAPRAAGDR
jgi:predicted signal transduction protein with EAL and GGDEF domain